MRLGGISESHQSNVFIPSDQQSWPSTSPVALGFLRVQSVKWPLFQVSTEPLLIENKIGWVGTFFPGEHFLGDDVGFFADSAGEQVRALKNRRADFVEVVGSENVADGGLDEVPQRRVGREKVARSSRGFDHV